MPKLSIVIPALGSPELLEVTLVSVLQNRPDDCEIVVLLNSAYDDPYALGDEVRFVTAAEAQSPAAALRHSLALCRGDIIHVLTPGVEVEEGWTEAALSHFCDNRVAAVSPLVFRSRESEHICSVGLEYGVGGSRKRRGCGGSSAEIRSGIDILGPTLYAAFYRREVLRTLPAPFDARVTDALVDVDLALQIRAAGYRAVLEPRSFTYRGDARLPEVAPLAAGRGAERLFWRNAPAVGWLRSLATHGFTVVGDLFAHRSVAQALARLVGRLTACLEIRAYHRHHRALAALGKPGLAYTVTSTGDQIRVDAAHPRSTGGVKTPKTADHRREGGSEQSV